MTGDPRTASLLSRLAWAVAIVIVLLAVVAAPVMALSVGVPFASLAGNTVTVIVLTVPGWILASRLPRNPAGWLLLTAALGQALTVVLLAYGQLAVQVHPGLPLGLAAWTAGSAGWWLLTFFFLPLLLMTFPDGRLPSRRWRPLAISLILSAALAVTAVLFARNTLDGEHAPPPNPFGGLVPAPVLIAVGAVAGLLFILSTMAAVVSLVGRMRRSVGVQRAQYQWITLGATICAVSMVLSLLAGLQEVVFIGLLVLLTCLTVAMVRYRLFEIGRVVSRTISYLMLTALLSGGYVGVVTVLSALLPHAGSLAVAVSTLVAAAAFNPLRRRVQTGVDRRFNRRRYDATRTVDSFAHRLRSELDLDTLVTDLRGVVQATLEPVGVQVWLRPRETER